MRSRGRELCSPQRLIQNIKNSLRCIPPLKGKPYPRKCLSVVKDPRLQRVTQFVTSYLKQKTYEGLKGTGVSFLALMGLWFLLGLAHQKREHQRGSTLVTWRTLRRILRNQKQASYLKLGKLPLLKDKETSHILMTGTTGSGKTNAFHILIPQIRKRRKMRNDFRSYFKKQPITKALIVDVTGAYVSRYYNEKTDIILNPLDIRSKAWTPWADCHLDAHYDVLAHAFIPDPPGGRDPFWDNASRIVLKTALRKYAEQGNPDIHHLTNFLLTASAQEFETFFKNTDAATFACKTNEKTTQSIRSVLSSQIEGLRQLKVMKDSEFSLREWIRDDTQKG